MLDLIITCYKLTVSVSSYLQEYIQRIQYPVDYTYHNRINQLHKTGKLEHTQYTYPENWTGPISNAPGANHNIEIPLGCVVLSE